MKQILYTVDSSSGTWEYDAFWDSNSGSERITTFQEFLDSGWYAKHIRDFPKAGFVQVVFEKPDSAD